MGRRSARMSYLPAANPPRPQFGEARSPPNFRNRHFSDERLPVMSPEEILDGPRDLLQGHEPVAGTSRVGRADRVLTYCALGVGGGRRLPEARRHHLAL